MDRGLRIVFMGTPEFAVPSLEAIIADGWQVVAVVTAPDRPAGRGMKLQASAVKLAAERHRIPVLQPEKLRDPEFLEALGNYRPDLQVVVAFRMLPEMVWNLPPMGTINLHASLLPDYRGAAPINWAIINGEKITGLTSFKLQHAIDTGNILLQQELSIGPEETAGELHDRMKLIGAELLVKTIDGLARGTLQEKPQAELSGGVEKIAPKLFTGTSLIDWQKPVQDIYNHIRGLSPYPAAFTYIGDKMLKIFSASMHPGIISETPGRLISDNKNYLRFAGIDGYIECKEIQLSGKKRIFVKDFLRGNTIVDNT